MEVQSSSMWIRMAIPATFPLGLIDVVFDILDRKIRRREPPNVQPSSRYRFRIAPTIEGDLELSGFVGVWLEFRLGNERIRREVTLKES
jgi:hypothetical protein